MNLDTEVKIPINVLEEFRDNLNSLINILDPLTDEEEDLLVIEDSMRLVRLIKTHYGI